MHIGLGKVEAEERNVRVTGAPRFRLQMGWAEWLQKAGRRLKEAVARLYLDPRTAGEVKILELVAAMRAAYEVRTGSQESELLMAMLTVLNASPVPYDSAIPGAWDGTNGGRAYATALHSTGSSQTHKVTSYTWSVIYSYVEATSFRYTTVISMTFARSTPTAVPV